MYHLIYFKDNISIDILNDLVIKYKQYKITDKFIKKKTHLNINFHYDKLK